MNLHDWVFSSHEEKLTRRVFFNLTCKRCGVTLRSKKYISVESIQAMTGMDISRNLREIRQTIESTFPNVPIDCESTMCWQVHET